MKRYMLFIYEDDYPSGGMNDFIGSYDKVIECVMAAKEHYSGPCGDSYWVQIYDTKEMKEVFTTTHDKI